MSYIVCECDIVCVPALPSLAEFAAQLPLESPARLQRTELLKLSVCEGRTGFPFILEFTATRQGPVGRGEGGRAWLLDAAVARFFLDANILISCS